MFLSAVRGVAGHGHAAGGALNLAAWDMIRDIVSAEPSLNHAAWESLRGGVALLGPGEEVESDSGRRFRRAG